MTSLPSRSSGNDKTPSLQRPTSRISVIIPSYEGAATLPGALASILAQTVPPEEILVVDDSRTRAVEEIVESLADSFKAQEVPLKYLSNPGVRGLPAARNAGVERVQGEIVLFVDDDVVLRPNYVEELSRTYDSNPDAKGVQGYWGPDARTGLSSFLQDSFGRIFFLWHYTRSGCEVLPSATATYPRSLARVTHCQWLSGSNMSYRRSVFDEVRFDERLKRYACGEDIDFSYGVFQRHPGCLLINPRARLSHKAIHASGTVGYEVILMRFVYSRFLFHKHFRPTLRNRLVFSWSTVGRVLEHLIRDITARQGSNHRLGLRSFKAALSGALLSRAHEQEIGQQDLGFFDKILLGSAETN